MEDKTFCLWHHKAGCNQGGTCGRITMWASTWFEINGYDEELLPTGYEDIDMMHRNGTNRKRIQAATEVGEAIPNEPTSKSYAMGSFKMKYTTFASSMTFGDMNKENQRTCSRKLSRGIMIRNTTEAGELKDIGLPTNTIFELDKVGCATLIEAPAWEPAASKKLKMGVHNVTIVTAGAHNIKSMDKFRSHFGSNHLAPKDVKTLKS